MLTYRLHSFLAGGASANDGPFSSMRVPSLGLSLADKSRIRNRSSILARQIYADQGEEFVGRQVGGVGGMEGGGRGGRGEEEVILFFGRKASQGSAFEMLERLRDY